MVIGGIYGGIFTPTEAAAASAVYALFISLFIYRDIKIKDLWDICLDSALTTAMIFFIIANAVVFAYLLTSEQIPQAIASMILDANIGMIGFLIFVNILLFIMGQFMEPSSVIMIMVPLLLPIATQLGVDPIHFGIILVVNMEIGMVTPPVGLNLFVASGLTNMNLKRGHRGVFAMDANLVLWPYLGYLYTANFTLATKHNVWTLKFRGLGL